MKHTFHAAEKIILLLLCVCLAGILSACGSSGGARAPAAAAELGIYAFGTTTISNKDQGHTFLTLKNTSGETMDFLNYPLLPDQEITIAYWPGGDASPGVAERPRTGVYLNFDAIKDVRNQDGQHDVVSMRKNLTAGEIQTLIEFTVEFTGTTYGPLRNNCTTFAVEAWNLVNDELPIDDTSFLNKNMDVDAPKWTKEYILENIDNDRMTLGKYDPYDNLDDFDVFMVNPDRSLIPYYISLYDYSVTVDMENTPTNIDVSWEKRAKELYDGTIPVNQVWIAYMEKGADQTDFTEMRIDADKGGHVLAGMEKRTTYLVKLCPLYEYTYKGSVQYVSGDWTPVMEVRTGPMPEIVFTYDYGTEIGKVIATDADTGEFVWSYFAPGGDPFQLDRSAEVGLDGEQYYLQDERDLICFDAYTGEVLWRLEGQIEWGPVSAFDEDGNLYLTFFLSDQILQISPEGEVLHTLHTDEFGYADAYWPTELRVEDGVLAVHYVGDIYGGDSGDHWAHIDLETWTFSNE